MDSISVWSKLNQTFGAPQSFWDAEEFNRSPSLTDRLVYYLIGYFESPAVARNAIRIFVGIEKTYETTDYCDWHEVRVASLGDVQSSLKKAGASGDSWELAVTLKDFLQNALDTLESVELDEIHDDLKPAEIAAYLKQLRGLPEAWQKNGSSPHRPADTSLFSKQCKRHRKAGEAVLPENVTQYLEFLLGRTSNAPFEYHANKVLTRLGLFAEQEKMITKIAKFNEFVGEERPINKHRHLVQFSKNICTSQPRCNICPFNQECNYAKGKAVVTT